MLRNIARPGVCAVLQFMALVAPGLAQTPPVTEQKPAAATDTNAAGNALLTPLAWLEGCWGGSVNKREFREHWLPLHGDVMVGAGQTVRQGKTLDYEYLRLEPRADGVYYIAASSGQKETSFRLTGKTTDGPDEIFTFERSGDEFPQRIIYRRATEGWLYAHVEGKLQGQDKRVIYPMRQLDCRTGEFIHK